MKVAVIGGGPAGMLAAISAANMGDDVTLFEKNNILGKKILITGKGRCNITSSLEIGDFIANIPGNGKFLFSAFENFDNTDIISMLEKEGVKVKEERGNRIFPVSDKAEDVRTALEKILRKSGVKIKLNARVIEIEADDGKVKSVILENEKFSADKVILATGGRSYPLTGSTGDGYKIAESLGHTIKAVKGSLVPMIAEDICKKLQGLSLRNVGIYIYDKEKDKKIYQDFGEMLFTHFGVSGPTILSGSAHVLRYKNVEEKMRNGNIILKIDLKPALTLEQLDARVLRDFEEFKNKQFKNSLDKLLPKKIIDVVLNKSKINLEKQVNEITKDERTYLVKLLKNFEIRLLGFRPVEEAIITAGGIDIKEINPKTMESKIVSGLYFAGEIIDVDAYTGGFNLQIAYSTGWTSGMKF
ncbi:MAG: NAD(P)/FAD-dependent oxidoreductase [Clostridia bacterium]